MARFGKVWLLYGVALFCFCLTFVCSYHKHTSGYSMRKYQTKYSKLKEKFEAQSWITKDNVRVQVNIHSSSLREHDERVDGGNRKKEPKLQKIKKIGKSASLKFVRTLSIE